MILEGINILLILVLVYLFFMLGYGIYWMNKEPTKYVPPDIEKEAPIEKSIELRNEKIDSLITIETGQFQGIVSLGIESKDYFEIDWGNCMISPYYGSNFKQILPPIVYKPGIYSIKIKSNCKSLSFNCNQQDSEFKLLKMENCNILESVSFNVKKIEKVDVKNCPKIKLWNLPK
jgi:hypothetical protein